MPDALVDDVVLVANEACTNCVEHAYRGHDVETMLLEVKAVDGEIRARVTDSGSWKTPAANPGNGGQSVTNAPVGTQLDDTVYATAADARLFVVDGSQNATYIVRANFAPGTLYTETPNDSGVAGLLATVHLATGQINPVAIGFGKPTGLLFAPADSGGDR